MGGKTELATISLAVEYRDMAYMLMGAMRAMVVADATGRLAVPPAQINWKRRPVCIMLKVLWVGQRK